MTDPTAESDREVQERAGQLAWNLFQELRKEILESQKLRAQLIGFKVTFIGTLVVAVAANLKAVPPALLVVPALSAAFFDFLVAGYSFSIKRLGFYSREHLEPILRRSNAWPSTTPLWQEFMLRYPNRPFFGVGANFALTALVIALAAVGVLYDHPDHPQLLPIGKAALLAILAVFLWLSQWSFATSKEFTSSSNGGNAV